MKIKVITHYAKDDTGFFGDYLSIDIKISNRIVVSFGDDYHDKGLEKLEGWIEGFKFAATKYGFFEDADFEIESENKASGKY